MSRVKFIDGPDGPERARTEDNAHEGAEILSVRQGRSRGRQPGPSTQSRWEQMAASDSASGDPGAGTAP